MTANNTGNITVNGSISGNIEIDGNITKDIIIGKVGTSY